MATTTVLKEEQGKTYYRTTLTPEEITWGKKSGALIIESGYLYGEPLKTALQQGYHDWSKAHAVPHAAVVPVSQVHPSLQEVVQMQEEGTLPAGDPQQVAQDVYGQPTLTAETKTETKTTTSTKSTTPKMTEQEKTALAVASMAQYEVDEGKVDVARAIEEKKIPEEAIRRAVGDEPFEEIKQSVEQVDTFERYNQKNPADNQYYSNKDLAPYAQEFTGKIDWKEFNTDQARAKISKNIDAVGLEKTIKQYEMAPSLKSFERQALIEAKRLVQDPVTKELYPKNYYKPYADSGILTKAESQQLFDTGGMQSVVSGINAKIAFQVARESITKSDIENKFLDKSLLDKTTYIQRALSPEDVTARTYGLKPYKELLDKTFGEERKYPDGKHPAISEVSFLELWSKTPDDVKQKALNQFQINELSKEGNQWYEYMIPIYGTKLTIDERGWKSGWSWLAIAGDALIFMPAIKGTSIAARTIGTPTSTAYRVGTAAKGGIKAAIPSLSNVSIKKSITAPITSITDRMRYGYVPLAGIETSSSTVRIPIKLAGTPQKAIRIRDELMEKLIAGKKPVTTVDNVTYELDQAMITSRGAHASPGITGITEGGIKVKLKYDNAGNLLPDKEQGLFIGSSVHSRFVPSTAFGKIPENVEKGVVLFGKSAEDTVSSGKLYRSTAELERKFPIGAKLPKFDKQGFSRTADGTKFGVYSEEPLSITRRISTKLVEPFLEARSVFTPAIKVRGKKLGKPMDLLDEARLYDDAAVNAEKSGKHALAARLRNEASSLRVERLSRPMTRQSARGLSSEFARAANTLRQSSANFRSGGYVAEAEQLRSLSDFYSEASRVMKDASRSQAALDYYNSNLLRNSNTDVGRAISQSARIADIPRGKVTNGRLDIPQREIITGRTPRDIPEKVPVRIPTKTPTRIPPEQPPTRITLRTPERIPPNRPPTRVPTRIPPEQPPKKPLLILPPEDEQKLRKVLMGELPGILAWRQGRTKGSGQGNWYVLYPPYKQDNLRLLSEPPTEAITFEGKDSAILSLQTIGGTIPRDQITVDMGIQDIIIRPPSFPGDTGGIKYVRDPQRQTISDITTKNVPLRGRSKSKPKPKKSNPMTAGIRQVWG